MNTKITNFTWEEFWAVQDEYNDMMDAIENRALDIARNLGKTDSTWRVEDVYFSHDQWREYVHIQFVKEVDGEEQFNTFKFDSDWLFSDDYKSAINQEELRAKIEAEKEYQEYLRLKEKFEPKIDKSIGEESTVNRNAIADRFVGLENMSIDDLSALADRVAAELAANTQDTVNDSK